MVFTKLSGLLLACVVCFCSVNVYAQGRPDPREINEKYSAIIVKANKAFSGKKLVEAEQLYLQALQVKPGDSWCKYQLNIINGGRKPVNTKEKETVVTVAYQKPVDLRETLENKMPYGTPPDQKVPVEVKKDPEDVRSPSQPAVDTKTESKNQSSIPVRTVANKTDNQSAPAVKKQVEIEKPATVEKLTTTEKPPVEKPAIVEKRATPDKPVVEKPATVEKRATVEKPRLSAAEINRRYEVAIRRGNLSMKNEYYDAAKLYFQEAKELKPSAAFPSAQLELIETKLTESKAVKHYETVVHLADSLAWVRKDHKAAIRWYDSAAKLKPEATYPKKQVAAIKQILLEKEVVEKKRLRSEAFNAAMGSYKKAEALRMEAKYVESYKKYWEFLGKLDTLNLNEYPSAELHYINQAKDYIKRLQSYQPKPEITIEQPAPVDNNNKKKKKKGRQ